MIPSLPELPKHFKNNPYKTDWRRVLGVLRVRYLLAVDAYGTLLGNDATEKERRHAMSRLLQYSSQCASLTANSRFDALPEFISNDENWPND